MNRRNQLPPSFHRFFWDCRAADLDIERNAAQISMRLLDYGDLEAARWALRTYGPARIRQFILARGRKTLSRKTLAFWGSFLNLEDEECLQPSSLRNNGRFWNT